MSWQCSPTLPSPTPPDRLAVLNGSSDGVAGGYTEASSPPEAATATRPSRRDLEERIADLEAEIAKLRTNSVRQASMD